ncbi:ribosome maturation factor RimM [Candidatus Persebacteraceae bacterium Df01]|uniref:Ribosome maturation factor RimM n=1 Tax=Candidatus Doriopsillibacter californiensis TaxID=2970740 RepID=A0ABT7QL00_9GAMM|nr:ribosome maturation factor RimM [Candidatus Persebacteraceae bacterium Df01]
MPPKATPDTAQKIVIGRFGTPHGVHGWLHARGTRSQSIKILSECSVWWRRAGGEWQLLSVESVRAHGKGLMIKISGVDDREQASLWCNADIAVHRADLPVPVDNEYYWCDLVGLTALDDKGDKLGTVSGLMETGANDVLRIEHGDGEEILVPFVDVYVQKVDIEGGNILLDWKRNW